MGFSPSGRAGEMKLGTTLNSPARSEAKLATVIPPPVADPELRNETLSVAVVPGAPGAGQPAKGQKLIASMAWTEVKPLLARGEIILVDARDAVSFEAGHIPGAVSLPLVGVADKMADFSAKHPKTKPVVTYCGSVGCPMAHLLAVALTEQHGYTDVREMPGGYAEWRVTGEKEGGK